MKRLLSCMIIAAAITSCTGDLRQYQKFENSAMSAVHVPLYEGITDIMRDNSFKSLKPGTEVYLTGDSAVGNNIPYVKITWADSSAYARADMLMPRGRWAVLTANNSYDDIVLYDSPALTNKVETINDNWQLTVAGEALGNATPVLYQAMGGVQRIAYIENENALTDQTNVDFYNAFFEAQSQHQQGNDEPLKDLANNATYKTLKIYTWHEGALGVTYGEDSDPGTEGEEEGDSPYAEGDAEYGDYDDPMENMAREHDWVLGENMLTDEEAPGTIKKYFVLEDGTEISAEGSRISNGYPYRDTDAISTKMVKRVRFELTLKEKTSVRFDVATFAGMGSEYNTEFTKQYDGEAGKSYSVIVEETPANTMILCSVIRVDVTAAGATAAATITGECGD